MFPTHISLQTLNTIDLRSWKKISFKLISIENEKMFHSSAIITEQSWASFWCLRVGKFVNLAPIILCFFCWRIPSLTEDCARRGRRRKKFLHFSFTRNQFIRPPLVATRPCSSWYLLPSRWDLKSARACTFPMFFFSLRFHSADLSENKILIWYSSPQQHVKFHYRIFIIISWNQGNWRVCQIQPDDKFESNLKSRKLILGNLIFQVNLYSFEKYPKYPPNSKNIFETVVLSFWLSFGC